MVGEDNAHLDDIGVSELAEILYLANSRHVQAVLEEPDLDFLDGDLAPSSSLAPCAMA
jgi:hypothetical protein